jgi:hypothetical protein
MMGAIQAIKREPERPNDQLRGNDDGQITIPGSLEETAS